MGTRSDARPLRSALFIAGSDESELEQAASRGADAIVIDIEEPRTPIAHEIFSPTAEEISYWQDLDRLATEAERNGSGPMNLDWADRLGLVKERLECPS